MSEKQDKHVEVVVLTTSGRWPSTGFESVPDHQKVQHVLNEAARHLHIASTEGWIATVGTKPLNVGESFEANGFKHGEVQIDFGPRHGGGGNA
jgi:hypothetical protein